MHIVDIGARYMIDLSDRIEYSARSDNIYDEYAIYASLSENCRQLFKDL